jgi:hypothetical protein
LQNSNRLGQRHKAGGQMRIFGEKPGHALGMG